MTSTTAKPSKSLWADVPRRLATCTIGFPLVWFMLSQRAPCAIFFMGAHAISLWEFTFLEPVAAATSNIGTSAKSRGIPGTADRLSYCVVSILLSFSTLNDDKIFQLLLCCLVGALVWMKRHHWILGLVVVTIPFRAWLALAPNDFASTISLLLVVWNCDTGALLAGRITSKLSTARLPVPQWIRVISPAKSIEGFLGGIMGGTWTAVSWVPMLLRWAPSSMQQSPEFEALWKPLQNRVLMGISFSCLAIIGDLIESSIKRQSQSKDSGSVLPGMGGVLDRFDSSLLAVLLYEVILEASSG